MSLLLSLLLAPFPPSPLNQPSSASPPPVALLSSSRLGNSSAVERARGPVMGEATRTSQGGWSLNITLN